MPSWRDPKLEELTTQLTYSSAEMRATQLAATVDLLPLIDPLKHYPWEFILFRITGYRPKTPVDHEIPGKFLRADLSKLVELLSETLAIKVEDAKEPVLALEQVTSRFNVSTKTIQRWRRQGLLAMRYIFPDGRRRLGFLTSAVTQFASTNAERISKSSTFKQLTDDEKRDIIAAARTIKTRQPAGIKEISIRVARRLGRSPETIRYTIRKHDLDHPEAAVFPDPADTIRPAERQRILEILSTGESIEGLAERFGHSKVAIDRLVNETQVAHTRALEIDFIPNPLFDLKEADEVILHVLPAKAFAEATKTVAAGQNAKADDLLMARVPRDLPPLLAQAFRTPVMPQELETDSFRRLNYLKFKAAKLRDALTPAATPKECDAVDALLLQAAKIKNELLQTNLRVAVHVARKHQRFGSSLMELVSDASIWLMRAIEKFDYARGVRFSTYASYSIMKNFARGRVEQLARRDYKFVTGQEEILSQVRERDGMSIPDTIDLASDMGDLVEVLERLPARDRELIRSHYGLGESDALSLSELAAKLGVTKTRVQQLESAAIKKLRRLMHDHRRHQTTHFE